MNGTAGLRGQGPAAVDVKARAVVTKRDTMLKGSVLVGIVDQLVVPVKYVVLRDGGGVA